MSKRNKVWLGAVAGLLAIRVFAALVVPRSFGLTALSDVIDCLLLASGAAAFFPLALRSRGRMRMFWSLITLGISLQFSYQVFWTYYEIVLRREVPDLCIGDVMLFLHMVPLMAALALRPHAPRDEYAARLGRLDFMLLLMWWFYLYVLIVIPWQYVMVNVPIYDRNLNAVYLAENLAFLAGLVACWFRQQGCLEESIWQLSWPERVLRPQFHVANWALARKRLLQRQPLRYSPRRSDGLSHLDRSALQGRGARRQRSSGFHGLRSMDRTLQHDRRLLAAPVRRLVHV